MEKKNTSRVAPRLPVDDPDERIVLAAASPMTVPGDIENNADKIIEVAHRAEKDGAQMLVLPEMCLSGATLGTAAANDSVTEAVKREILRICSSTEELGIVLAIPHAAIVGDKLRSCVTVSQGGIPIGLMALGMIEYPYGWRPPLPYETLRTYFSHALKNFQLIGGPVLHNDNTYTFYAPYMLISSGFNATARSFEDTRERLIYHSLRQGNSMAYASPNRGESTSAAVFDGYCAIASGGKILAEALPFSADAYCTAEVSVLPERDYEIPPVPEYESFLHSEPERAARECRRIIELQAAALRRRLEHIHGKGFVVGVSGGLDSALALIACCSACDEMQLPRSSVLGVSMPGFGSSKRTRSNAEQLVEALGCTYMEIPIVNACRQHFLDIGLNEDDRSTVFENAQARERTKILLSLANMHGLLDVGTGDLSEAALGWTTFGGDNLAQYGINGSLPKSVIRRVVAEAVKRFPEAESVLRDILDTPVSPELLPGENGEIAQKTESILGSYDMHDFLIYNMIFKNRSLIHTLELALTAHPEHTFAEWLSVIKKFIDRVYASEFKRKTAPECPNVLLSLAPPDFDIPGDIVPYTWRAEYEELIKAALQVEKNDVIC